MRPKLVLVALLAVAGFARADDKFIDLTPLLPPDANAATVIDVQAIYNSPLGKRKNGRPSGHCHSRRRSTRPRWPPASTPDRYRAENGKSALPTPKAS